MPPSLGAGTCREKNSPLHLHRMEFHGQGYWCLSYNTRDFGWFHKGHIVQFSCGLKVWAPCPLMCRWLSHPRSREAASDVREQSVLELGSGTGMLGTSLGLIARRVVITDIDAVVLHVAALNAHINSAGTHVEVHKLAYGREEAKQFREKQGRFDRIVGADIVYAIEVMRPIFATVDELLAPTGVSPLAFRQFSTCLR